MNNFKEEKHRLIWHKFSLCDIIQKIVVSNDFTIRR